MKFLIKVGEYTDRIGGIVVLHKLAYDLKELNEDVYLISDGTFDGCSVPCINDEYALNLIKNDIDNVVVIYPESVYVGNPLNAKNVIRWALYIPGFHGGDKIFDSNEHVFLYNKDFGIGTIYEDRPILHTFMSKSDKFYDMGNHRSGDCFVLKKGQKTHTDVLPG
jgi:hypothetical protein